MLISKNISTDTPRIMFNLLWEPSGPGRLTDKITLSSFILVIKSILSPTKLINLNMKVQEQTFNAQPWRRKHLRRRGTFVIVLLFLVSIPSDAFTRHSRTLLSDLFPTYPTAPSPARSMVQVCVPVFRFYPYGSRLHSYLILSQIHCSRYNCLFLCTSCAYCVNFT